MKNEPSMEQILASIRKIMAEEAAGQTTGLLGLSSPKEADDTILELTEVVEEDSAPLSAPVPDETVEKSPSIEPFSPPEIAATPELPSTNSTDSATSLMETASSKPDDRRFDTPTESVPPLETTHTQQNYKQEVFPPHQSLLSDSVVDAGVHALQELKQASNKTRPPLQTADSLKGKTIDDLMVGLLRPLLSDWLNQNLPQLVEKVVKEEIRKLTARI